MSSSEWSKVKVTSILACGSGHYSRGMLTSLPMLLGIYPLDCYWVFARCCILRILRSWPSLRTWWSPLFRSSLRERYVLILVEALRLVVGEVEVQGEGLLQDRVPVLVIHPTGLDLVFIWFGVGVRRFHCTCVWNFNALFICRRWMRAFRWIFTFFVLLILNYKNASFCWSVLPNRRL